MHFSLGIRRLILRFELLLACLWTLIPDAHYEGCDPPFVPAWVWPAIERVQGVLASLYALVGG